MSFDESERTFSTRSSFNDVDTFDDTFDGTYDDYGEEEHAPASAGCLTFYQDALANVTSMGTSSTKKSRAKKEQPRKVRELPVDPMERQIVPMEQRAENTHRSNLSLTDMFYKMFTKITGDEDVDKLEPPPHDFYDGDTQSESSETAADVDQHNAMDDPTVESEAYPVRSNDLMRSKDSTPVAQTDGELPDTPTGEVWDQPKGTADDVRLKSRRSRKRTNQRDNRTNTTNDRTPSSETASTTYSSEDEDDDSVSVDGESAVGYYAIPIINYQNEYFVYSPESLTKGVIDRNGVSAIVVFEMWIRGGYLHLQAENLRFAFSLPILLEDCIEDDYMSTPLRTWLARKSARFICFLYYIAAAADVMEGNAVNLFDFMKRVRVNEDYRVVRDGRDALRIEVLDGELDRDVTHKRDSRIKWYAAISNEV